MIALDTNVVVRFLVEDDAKQVRRVRQLLEAAVEAGEPCFLSDCVLCEIEWVLESNYGARRADIGSAVQHLIEQGNFVFEDVGAVGRALELYRTGKADLSDCLIGQRARSKGARTTFTFDRALRGAAEFTVL